MMKVLTAGLAVAAASAPALADGQATIQSPTPEGMQSLQVSWTDDGMARFDPERTGAYMLVRDGTLYAVTTAGGMGPMVMDLSALGQMAGAAPMGQDQEMPGGITIERAESVVALDATGRSETVAGLDGELYEVTWTDANGEQHTDNAVLSDASLALELDGAFAALQAATTEGREPDARQTAVRERGLAILRYGESYTVVSASGDGRPAGAFELPAEPTDMGAMMQGMGPDR